MINGFIRKEDKGDHFIVHSMEGTYRQDKIPKPRIHCPCCKLLAGDNLRELEATESGNTGNTIRQHIIICDNCGVLYEPRADNQHKIDYVNGKNKQLRDGK